MTNYISLSEIAEPKGFASGPFGSNLVSKDYAESGVPVIRGSNMLPSAVIGGEFAFVTHEKFNRDLKSNSALSGDIVFTQRGTLGQVAVVPDSFDGPLVISQSQMRLRTDTSRFDTRYVLAACRSDHFKRQIADHAITGGVPHINLGILKELVIPEYPLEQQRAIGEVLGALDDKIAANRRVQQSIDDLLESAFRRVSRTANESVELGSLIVLNYGKSLPSAIRAEGTVPVVGSGGVVGYHDAHLVDGPAVVVGRKGSVGSTYWISEGCYPIDTTYWVTPSGVSLGYAYRLLQSIDFVSMNTDSAVPGLNRERAYALQVPLPDEEQLEQFDRLSESLTLKHSTLQKETGVLASARDELLPLLMAGRIAVREAERAAEALL